MSRPKTKKLKHNLYCISRVGLQKLCSHAELNEYEEVFGRIKIDRIIPRGSKFQTFDPNYWICVDIKDEDICLNKKQAEDYLE